MLSEIKKKNHIIAFLNISKNNSCFNNQKNNLSHHITFIQNNYNIIIVVILTTPNMRPVEWLHIKVKNNINVVKKIIFNAHMYTKHIQ